LGLAISRSIIDIHGGKLWVESTGEPGKGSIFKFVIPVNSEDYFKKEIKETDIFKLETNK
jgi:signal transduction histidine kinase